MNLHRRETFIIASIFAASVALATLATSHSSFASKPDVPAQFLDGLA